jgi:general secretion pathway protein K
MRSTIPVSAWRRRGSAIVLVLALIALAGLLLSQFIERAMTEMLVESRARLADRLRVQAHSALEGSLAVLADYQAVDGGLRSPEQGWGEPLAGFEFEARPDTTVEVQVEDESGRAPLPRQDLVNLAAIGEQLGLKPGEASAFADALMAWTHREHTPAGFETDPRNYEYEDPPHRAPGRPLASFQELAAVAVVRDLLFTPEGLATPRLAELARTVSLHDFPAVNLNTAPAGTLEMMGMDKALAERIAAHRVQENRGRSREPRYFRTTAEAQAALGVPLAAGSFDTLARCLRVKVLVREGATSFHLEAVVVPGADEAESGLTPTGRVPAGGADLRYPFKLLALEESIELAPAPAL